MASEHLSTYLNDHLAGATMALELLAHLERVHAGEPSQRFAAELRAEIEEDKAELERLARSLGAEQSATRQVTAWFGEKIARVKLRFDDVSGDGSFRLFEALEALSLGIEGKRSLWSALRQVAGTSPALQGVDYDRLEARAIDQRARVDARRLAEAAAALAPGA
jgi:hypothetical protein